MNNKHRPKRVAKNYQNLSRSVMQSHARTELTKSPKAKKLNQLSIFFSNRLFLWLFHYIKSRFGKRHEFLTYEGNADKGIYPLYSHSKSNSVKIALAADWGTDTEESKLIAEAVATHKPDYSIHLGDTYFVGAPFEIENNFKPGESDWHYGSVGSFSLTGNHEMYSNGNSYYEKLLPWMGIFHPQRIPQKASFFCLENDFWRVVGLDTGYRSVGIPFLEYFFSKADLRKELVEWLKNDLKIQNDNRGLILLSHHQYTSCFDTKYPLAAKQLAEIIGKERQVLWFWGHEHRFSIYGNYSTIDGIKAFGRCIGHGGMPTDIIKKPFQQNAKESNLILFDNRISKQIDDTDVGHNGYAILTIENENLNVDYYDEKDLLVTEQWKYDKNRQIIIGKSIKCNNTQLHLQQDIIKAIQ